MSLRHRDVDGTLLATTNSLPNDVLSDDVEEFPINLFGYNSPLIYQVDVELQQETSPDVWDVRGSQPCTSGRRRGARQRPLLGVGEDFGSGNYTGGAPTGSGTLTWDLANNTIKPRLTGNLYVQNGLGTDFRMRMRNYDVHGNHLGRHRQPPQEADVEQRPDVPDQHGRLQQPGDLQDRGLHRGRRLRDVDPDRRPAADVHHLTRRPNQSPHPRRRRLRPAPPRRVCQREVGACPTRRA